MTQERKNNVNEESLNEELFEEENIPYACPNCARGLVNKFKDDEGQGYRCDKCTEEWDNYLSIKKDQIASALDNILKEGFKTVIKVEYAPVVQLAIWRTNKDGTLGPLCYATYEDNADSIDELYDHANALADKFDLHAEYEYFLDEPENYFGVARYECENCHARCTIDDEGTETVASYCPYCGGKVVIIECYCQEANISEKIKLFRLLENVEKSNIPEGDPIVVGTKAYFRRRISNAIEYYTNEEIALENLVEKYTKEFNKYRE